MIDIVRLEAANSSALRSALPILIVNPLRANAEASPASNVRNVPVVKPAGVSAASSVPSDPEVKPVTAAEIVEATVMKAV
jgi:hypothetical protein